MPDTTAARDAFETTLPIYRRSLDWGLFERDNPVPDVFEQTMWRWSPERIRAMQNERFLDLIKVAWKNPFYAQRWTAAGLEPGDVRSIDDITKLPIFTSEDIKNETIPSARLHGLHVDPHYFVPFYLNLVRA